MTSTLYLLDSENELNTCRSVVLHIKKKSFYDKLPAIMMMPNNVMMMIWKCCSIEVFELMANYLLRYVYFTQCQRRHHFVDAGRKIVFVLIFLKILSLKLFFCEYYLLSAWSYE